MNLNAGAHPLIEPLLNAYLDLKRGVLSTYDFCGLARQQPDLFQELGDRYEEVLLNLIDRMESSSLFSEESCSFSQKDLFVHLDLWIKKSQERLESR